MNDNPFKPFTARSRTSSTRESTTSNPKNLTQDVTPTRFFVGNQFDTNNQNIVRVEIDSKFGKKSSAQYVHPQFAQIGKSQDYDERRRLKENRRMLIEKYGEEFVRKGWNLKEILEKQQEKEEDSEDFVSDEDSDQMNTIYKSDKLGDVSRISKLLESESTISKGVLNPAKRKEIIERFFNKNNCEGEVIKLAPMAPIIRKKKRRKGHHSIFPDQDQGEMPYRSKYTEVNHENEKGSHIHVTYTTWEEREALRQLAEEKGEGDTKRIPRKQQFAIVKHMGKGCHRFIRKYESEEEWSDHPDTPPPPPPPGFLKTKLAWATPPASTEEEDNDPISDNRVRRIKRREVDDVDGLTENLSKLTVSRSSSHSNDDVTSDGSSYAGLQMEEKSITTIYESDPVERSYAEMARKYSATRMASKTVSPVSRESSTTTDSFSNKPNNTSLSKLNSVSSVASLTLKESVGSIPSSTTYGSEASLVSKKSVVKVRTKESDSDTSSIEDGATVCTVNDDRPTHLILSPEEYSKLLEFFAARNLSSLELERCPDDPQAMKKFYTITTTLGMPDWNLERAAILDNLEEFIKLPVAVGFLVKCRVFRDKRGVDRGMFPTYVMHLENEKCKNTLLMTARKRKKSATTNYLISIDPLTLVRGQDTVVGKVRGNLVGTQFTIYDGGKSPNKCEVGVSRPREELGAIVYYPNLLGFKGPRKMKFLLPAMISESKRFERYPDGEHDSILGQNEYRLISLIHVERRHLLMDETANAKKGLNHGILELRNKPPIFNSDAHSFVLNFQGRVTEASVKNFQIIHPNKEKYTILQFGRVDKDIFALDIRYPLCPLQAFGIVLSSFTNKLAVE